MTYINYDELEYNDLIELKDKLYSKLENELRNNYELKKEISNDIIKKISYSENSSELLSELIINLIDENNSSEFIENFIIYSFKHLLSLDYICTKLNL